jgi:hypothetical protein
LLSLHTGWAVINPAAATSRVPSADDAMDDQLVKGALRASIHVWAKIG